jgi:hypothetical protein
MNPALLIPVADTFSVPWGWFQFLLMLTFPLHLIAMNAMLGSALIAFTAHFLPGRLHRELSHELAKALPFLVAFTINFGVAPLLFINVIYGHLFYTSTVLMGIFWLAVIPILIIAYYIVYIYDFSFEKLGGMAVAAILAALLLLLTVGFLFSNNMTMMIAPTSWSRWFGTPGGTLLNMADPTLPSRYLHIITGSLAVGGLFVALYASTLLKGNREVSETGKHLGMKLFTWMTGLQFVMGFWFLLSLSPDVMKRFMGGDALSTVLLIAGLALAVLTMITGARGKIAASVWLTLPLIYVMSFMRDSVRTGYLAPYLDVAKTPVQTQWSPLLFFLVTLVVSLGVIVWMLFKVKAAGKTA